MDIMMGEKKTLPVGNNWRSLTSEVYEEIKHKIQKREYKPGQQLVIREVAEDLKVSVTPVQNALKMLQSEGLVVRKGSRGGVMVTSLRAKNISEILNLRQLLEIYSIETIIMENPLSEKQLEKLEYLLTEMERFLKLEPETKEDDSDMDRFSICEREFHKQLIYFTNNETLIDLYDRLWIKMKIIMNLFWTVNRSRSRRPKALEELKTLFTHLKAGNYEKAKAAVRNHYRALEEKILEKVKETEAY